MADVGSGTAEAIDTVPEVLPNETADNSLKLSSTTLKYVLPEPPLDGSNEPLPEVG